MGKEPVLRHLIQCPYTHMKMLYSEIMLHCFSEHALDKLQISTLPLHGGIVNPVFRVVEVSSFHLCLVQDQSFLQRLKIETILLLC